MERLLWVALLALPTVMMVWFAALMAGAIAGATR